ncbi:hypothetical protein E4U60_006701 [Claviceps pazoutovae]|uniref:Uncharacterized protein n=1 Tax=Claviceps pazoutovae TaxID=1649127 RepID=A0A9P7MGE7_9HYPO|nr:hypothetical protein E4U60_006701 [Claviceps pazoutovae]
MAPSIIAQISKLKDVDGLARTGWLSLNPRFPVGLAEKVVRWCRPQNRGLLLIKETDSPPPGI